MTAPSHAMFEPSKGRRISRRDQFLSIAADLFADRGFAGVTVEQIGAAAGVSGPAIYHHFDSKEALLGEMLIRVSESILSQARELVQLSDDPTQQLRGLVAKGVEFAVDNTSLLTVHTRDLVHARKGDRGRIRELQNMVIDLWVDVLAAQEAAPPDERLARTAVHSVLGLINSTPFSARLRREEVVPLLESMAWGALQAVLDSDSVGVRG